MRERLVGTLLGHRIPLPPTDAPPGIVLRSGRLAPWLGGRLARMHGPAAAVTLGRTIVLHPDSPLTPELWSHELTHVRQWQRDRLFPFRYALATLQHGYTNNPYEVEARALATSEWVAPFDQTRT